VERAKNVFLQAIIMYRMMDPKHNEVRKPLGITDIDITHLHPTNMNRKNYISMNNSRKPLIPLPKILLGSFLLLTNLDMAVNPQSD
jgi:hypothetical protein